MSLMRLQRWFLGLLMWLMGCGVISGQTSPVNVSGVIFTDYSYETPEGTNAFSIDRVYVNLRGALSPAARFRVTSDVRPPDASDSGYHFILKYAYVNWHPGKLGAFSFGLMNTGAFVVQERTWGLRYLFKTALEQYSYAQTTDLGIGYQAEPLTNLSFMAKLTNGNGFAAGEMNTGKRLHLRLLYGSDNLSRSLAFNAILYGSVEYISPNERDYIYSVSVGRHSRHFWVGSEFGSRSSDLSFSPETQNYFYSFYGRLEIAKNIQIFGRTDYQQDASGLANNPGAEPVTQRWHLAGIQFSGISGVKVTPNVVYHSTIDQNTLFLRLSCEIKF